MQNFSFEKEFDSHENELVVEKHFHAFARLRLLSKQRKKAIRKLRPIALPTRKTQGESHLKGRCSKMKIVLNMTGLSIVENLCLSFYM